MIVRILAASLITAGLFAATPVFAADTGFYLGGGVGKSDFSGDISQQIQRAYQGDPVFSHHDSRLSDDGDTAYKAFAGYRFLPWLGVEAAWQDLGEARSFYELSSNGLSSYRPMQDGSYRLRGASVSVFGELPLGDSFSVIARVGAFNARLEYTETGLEANGDPSRFNHRDSSTQTTAGLGLNWRVTQAWDVRLDWDRYFDIGERFALNETGNGRFDHVDMVSLNLAFRFGR